MATFGTGGGNRVTAFDEGAGPPGRRIRVLVVDDSACVREALSETLEADGTMEVVGQASNGRKAMEQVLVLKPDVITMDFQMPDMDGIEATRHIMEESPTPIVLVSGVLNPRESTSLFLALEAGALALVDKPRLNDKSQEGSVAHLIETVRLMSEVKVVRRARRRVLPVTGQHAPHKPGGACGMSMQDIAPHQTFDILCIGASTGGPQALEQLLSRLDPAFPMPVLVVQHIATGFLQGLVNWLNQSSALPVRIAQPGQSLQQGVISFAPDNWHMTVTRGLTIKLEDSPPEESVKPAVNKLFRSCACVFGKRAIGVLLTGMGRDGATGLKDMHRSGALTIVQDQASSIVFGMPGQAIKLGAARKIMPLQDMPEFLNILALGRANPPQSA